MLTVCSWSCVLTASDTGSTYFFVIKINHICWVFKSLTSSLSMLESGVSGVKSQWVDVNYHRLASGRPALASKVVAHQFVGRQAIIRSTLSSVETWRLTLKLEKCDFLPWSTSEKQPQDRIYEVHDSRRGNRKADLSLLSNMLNK